MDPLVGRSIDRYLLAGLLGQGGMGAVYVALQRPLMREVALKLISGVELTEQAVARFEREARAVAALDHPNIVRLYDYGVGDIGTEDGGEGHGFRVPYMALEYVRHGSTLRHAFGRLARETGSVPGDVVLHVFRQVLNALAAAHRVGIVHRDMKPDNVMVTAVEGNPHLVKLLDFGLAKAVAQVTGFDREVSRTGQFLGTPHYVAPEQVSPRDMARVDGRADLYAVAVMLFEVFTGVMPYDGDTPLEVLARKVDPGHDPFALDAARALPARLVAVLRKGLANDPAARHADAGEMLAALEAAIPGTRALAAAPITLSYTPGSDRPVTPATPPPRGSGPVGPTAWSGKALDSEDEERETAYVPPSDRRGIAGRAGRALVLLAVAAVAAVGAWVWLGPGGTPAVQPPAPGPAVAPPQVQGADLPAANVPPADVAEPAPDAAEPAPDAAGAAVDAEATGDGPARGASVVPDPGQGTTAPAHKPRPRRPPRPKPPWPQAPWTEPEPEQPIDML